MEMITLSLFVFNLLPIATLDGGQIFGLLLDICQSWLYGRPSPQYLAEVMEEGKGTIAPSVLFRAISRRHRVERYVGLVTTAVTAWVCIFSIAREIIG